MGNTKSTPRGDGENMSHFIRRRISRNSDDDGIEVADIASTEEAFTETSDDFEIELDDNRANNARNSNDKAELRNRITEASQGHQEVKATIVEQEALVASTGHHKDKEVDGEQNISKLESEISLSRRKEVLDGVIRRLRKDPDDTRSDAELLWDYKPQEPENEYSEFRRIHENRNEYQRTIYTHAFNGSDVYYKEAYDEWQIRKWSTEHSRRYSMREYREKTTLFQNGEIPSISSPPPKRFPRLGEEPIIHLRSRAKFKNNFNADTPAPWERKEKYDDEEEKAMTENTFMEEVTRHDNLNVYQKDNSDVLEDTGQKENTRSGCNSRRNKDVNVKYAHLADNIGMKATQENATKHSVKMSEYTTGDVKEYRSKEFCFADESDSLRENIWSKNKTYLHDKEESTWKDEIDEELSEGEVIVDKWGTNPTSQDKLSEGEISDDNWRTNPTLQDKDGPKSPLKNDEEDTVSIDERKVKSRNQQGKTQLLNTTQTDSDQGSLNSCDLSILHNYNENTPRTSQSSFSNDDIKDEEVTGGEDAEQKLAVKTKKKSKVGKLVRGVMKRARNMFRANKNENEISEEKQKRSKKLTQREETNDNTMTETDRSATPMFSVKPDPCKQVKEKAKSVKKTKRKVDRFSQNEMITVENQTKRPVKKSEAFVFPFSPEANPDEQFKLHNKETMNDSDLRCAKVFQSIDNSKGDDSEKDQNGEEDDKSSDGDDRDLKLELRRKAQQYGSLKHLKELKETKKTIERYTYNENTTVANQIKPSVKKAEAFDFSFSPDIKPDGQFKLQNKYHMNDTSLLDREQNSPRSFNNSEGNESEKEVEKQDDGSSDGGDRDLKLKLRKKAQKYGSLKHMKAIQKENEKFKKRLTNLRSTYSMENSKVRADNLNVVDRKDDHEVYNQREQFGRKSFRGQVNRDKQLNFDENTYIDGISSEIDTGKDSYRESKISDGQEISGRILNHKKYGSLAHMKQVKQENEQKKERLSKISTRVDTWKAPSTDTKFSGGRILDPRKYGSLAHMAQIKQENELKKTKMANIVSSLDTWKTPSQGRNLGGRDDCGRILDPKQYGSIAHMNQIKQENARRKSRLNHVVSNLDTWSKPNPGSLYSLKRKDEWQPVYDHRKYGSVAHYHQAKDANAAQRFLVKKATTKLNTWQPKSKMELLHKTPRQPNDNKTHVKQLQTTLKTAKSRIDTGIRSTTTATKNDHLLGNYSRYSQDELKSNRSNGKTVGVPERQDLQHGKPIMYTSLHNTTERRHQVDNNSMYWQDDKRPMLDSYPSNTGTAINEERHHPSWRYRQEETRPKFDTTPHSTTIMNDNFPQMAKWTKYGQGEARARAYDGVYNTTMEGPYEHHLANWRRCEREEDRTGFDTRQWNTELTNYNEHQAANWTEQTTPTSYLRRPQMSSARFPTAGRQYYGDSGTPGKSRLPVPTFYKAPWPPYGPTSGANCSSH